MFCDLTVVLSAVFPPIFVSPLNKFWKVQLLEKLQQKIDTEIKYEKLTFRSKL